MVAYLRGAPPWPLGASWREPRAFILFSDTDPINLDRHEGKGYLLVATPFDPDLTLTIPGPPMPFGSSDWRTPRSFTSQGLFATVYPAATGNAARSSANSDTPAATWVPGKLSGNFNYEVTLFAGALQGGSGSLGILELTDPDGELDDLRILGWDGALIELRRGDPSAAFSTYVAVAKLTTAGMRYNLRKKEILLRDLAWQLGNSELHGERYGGTGGVDGDASLNGRIKPYCIGSVFNVPALQINATNLIYQVSCSSVLGIDAVRDGGSGLTDDGDIATYAELEAAAVASGNFATCQALGIFKVGAAPVFSLTADVRGDNDNINGLTYPRTRAQIARRIATGRGLLKLRDPSQLDTAAFEYLDQWQTATLGYFWNDEVRKAAALDEVMAGCAGWWTMRLNGTLAVGQLEDPAALSTLFSLSYPTPTEESRVDEPSMTDYVPPRRSTLMGWRRNYTVMETNQIAGSVTQENAAIYTDERGARFTTSEDIWVSSSYPSAALVQLFGGFESEADAQAEGDRQRKLFRTRREPYSISVVMDPFVDVVGRVIQVNNSNRIGLGASRNLFCLGIAVNGNAKPILQLWG